MERGREIEFAANVEVNELNCLEGFDKTDMINMFGSGVSWADTHPKSNDTGCEFCKGKKVKEWKCLGRSRSGRLKHGNEEIIKRVDFGETCNLTIVDNILHVDYDAYSCDSSFNDEIVINYCPFCGRKLK